MKTRLLPVWISKRELKDFIISDFQEEGVFRKNLKKRIESVKPSSISRVYYLPGNLKKRIERHTIRQPWLCSCCYESQKENWKMSIRIPPTFPISTMNLKKRIESRERRAREALAGTARISKRELKARLQVDLLAHSPEHVQNLKKRIERMSRIPAWSRLARRNLKKRIESELLLAKHHALGKPREFQKENWKSLDSKPLPSPAFLMNLKKRIERARCGAWAAHSIPWGISKRELKVR